MRPLTPRVWQQHYTALRPHVLEEWPEVPRGELESVRDDWDGLVALIQRHSGLSSALITQRLRKLDVDELGLGVGAPEEEEEEGRATLSTALRLGDGFSQTDREAVLSRLAKLDRRLAKFPADGTELELSVKDRDATTQKVTAECWLPHFAKIVATSQEHDLRDALMEVREELWRQIDDAVSRRKEGAR